MSQSKKNGQLNGIGPNPPADLSPEALVEFTRILRVLARTQHVQEIDHELLACYAQEMVKYWQCEAVLTEKGLTMSTSTGYEAQRPEVSIGRNALAAARAIASEFGFTPKARKKIFELKASKRTKDPAEGSQVCRKMEVGLSFSF